MKRLLVLVTALVLASCAHVEPPAGAESTTETGALAGEALAEPAPVVLELFTSQGCSSCPPADRTLTRLGKDAALAGRVVPLAYHVDYWNYIGWRDPFSSPAWTERQYAYARAFKADGVYTPQLVVNGRTHLNGAEEARIRTLVAEMSRAPAARVALDVTRGDGTVAAVVRSEVGTAIEAAKLETVVVLFENGITTPVRRGENSGRTLENDYIVRAVERAGAVEPKKGASVRGSATFRLDPSWRADRLGVAAFVQDPSTMRIHGAAVHPPER